MSLYSALTQVLSPYAAKINGLLTGYDGTKYSTPGEAVRTQINDLHVLIGDEPGTAISASAIGYGEESVEDALDGLNERLTEVEQGGTGGLTADVKAALLDVVAHIGAWSDGNGQAYYDALEAALYPPANLVSISAVYTQSGAVYDNSSLDSLKSGLVVTAHYDNGTTAPITNYVLSGTLATGTSPITVSYGGKTTTFNVTVTHYEVMPLYHWDFTESLTDKIAGQVAETTGTLTEGTGLAFTASNQYADLGSIYAKNRTYEFEITAKAGNQTGYRRMIMSSSDANTGTHGNGLMIAPAKGGILFYNGSWPSSALIPTTDPADIVGKYSVYVDNNGYQTLYKNGVSYGTSPTADTHANGVHVVLGGNAADVSQSTYSYVKIYEGEVIN